MSALPTSVHEFISLHLRCENAGPPHTSITEYPDGVTVEMIECCGCYAQWLRVGRRVDADLILAEAPMVVEAGR